MTLKQAFHPARISSVVYAALAIATIGLIVAIYAALRQPSPATAASGQRRTVMDTIESSNTIRVGYGGFPPYTIVNPNESDPNKRVTGFVADMIDEIAKRHSPPLKVEWYNLDWDTFRADMLSGRFEFLADAVYETVPKAAEFGMTDPFSYFGIAVAVVKIDDDRFKTFQDLDNPNITIALAQGYATTEYAQRELSKPHFTIVPVGKDAFTQLDQVLLGRADVALNDVPTVVQYVRAHSDKVKGLWVDAPPSWVAASFVTRKEDVELLNFLNVALRIIQIDGTIQRLDRKWKTLGFFPKVDMVPGSGLH